MASDYVHLHAAIGRVRLTEIHKGRAVDGLQGINVMRWVDENGNVGQDTHVRLALYVERGGELS